MKKCKRTLLWLWMLTKRLYHKPTFLVVLALIPLVSFGYGFADLDDSGILTVVLAQEGQDPLAEQIIESLLHKSQLIRYVTCDSPDEAREMLEAGKADAAWIFPEELESKMRAFSQNPSAMNAFLTVLERQSDVTTRITREGLSETFYGRLSRLNYIGFIRENAPMLDTVSDEQLLSYYDNVAGPEELFQFTHLTGQSAIAGDSRHFLLWPVRGLLGVVIMLCALAAGMYYIQDRQQGTFSWVSEKRQALAELGCQLASVLQVTVIASVALTLLGLTADPLREVTIVLLYSLCCSAFAMLVRRACRTIGVMGVMLPLLILASLMACPVFLDLDVTRSFQFLLPPTYFINAVADGTYMLYMVLYTLCMWALYWLLGKCHRK